MRIHSINIKEFETNCDGILRQSIKHIFNSETDPITLIKIKDIYESLENIADKCQAVANNFETIIMKIAKGVLNYGICISHHYSYRCIFSSL